MHYHIYCKEKAIEENHREAIAEFEKRLSAYCETDIEVRTSLSFAREVSGLNHHFIYVNNGPSTYSSEEFADFVKELQLSGKSKVHIIIGYTEEELYEALNMVTDYEMPKYISLTRCSLSLKTQTLLFYEQLYRAYTILQGKTYHK